MLRHEPTGLVVTAYAGRSGPCYGGHLVTSESGELAAVEDEWGANEVRLLATAETGEMPSLALLEARRELRRKLVELRAPRHAPILEELETLVAGAPLADYARIDASSDFAVYRVGVESGEPFHEELAPREVVAWCLAALPSADPYRASFLATRLFAAFADGGDDAQRAEVRAAWCALLDRVEELAGRGPARSLWETLADHAEWLGVTAEMDDRLAKLEPPG